MFLIPRLFKKRVCSTEKPCFSSQVLSTASLPGLQVLRPWRIASELMWRNLSRWIDQQKDQGNVRNLGSELTLHLNCLLKKNWNSQVCLSDSVCRVSLEEHMEYFLMKWVCRSWVDLWMFHPVPVEDHGNAVCYLHGFHAPKKAPNQWKAWFQHICN